MRRAIVLAGIVVLLATACEGDEPDPVEDTGPDEIVQLRAKDMRGKYEDPPGDPKAKGFVGTDLNLTTGEVCIEYGTDLSEDPTVIHIHEGKAGRSGDPVVTLPIDGGCVEAEPDLLQGIADEPAAYYVNIHTAEYPDGAIRAQLEPQ